jgi:hypothetical protein
VQRRIADGAKRNHATRQRDATWTDARARADTNTHTHTHTHTHAAAAIGSGAGTSGVLHRTESRAVERRTNLRLGWMRERAEHVVLRHGVD